MDHESRLEVDYLETLPREWPESLLGAIRSRFNDARYKIVILDDDPTGTQTAKDLPVLTQWNVEALVGELKSPYPAFFILTNSRALPELQAVELAGEIGANLREASQLANRRTVVISRSDSTLRGHFPAEVDGVAEAMGQGNSPYLIIPFFQEGGRITMENVHYVKEGQQLIPAAQTPFAKDAAFGFEHSNLPKWVEEKTVGRIKAEDVVCITLDDIRRGGPGRVADILRCVAKGTACVVNCVTYRDMEVVVSALQIVENEGCDFLYRTAASFVRIRTGLDHREGLLSRDELVMNNLTGGLFVIGSHVEKTTRQLDVLFNQTDIVPIELDVEAILDDFWREIEIARAAHDVTSVIGSGRDAALFTSRKLVTGGNARKSLSIGKVVSESLITVVKSVAVQPRYLVAKGGITSSDVATDALGVRRAMVIGQAQPGVPAWRLGAETLYPGKSYIIFPGNVGADDALARLQEKLK